MPDYVIGDVHANPKALQALCELINLQPTDHLYFIGDLVGKGPDSWGVLKMLTTSLQHQHTLLIGNHDLHLLAKVCKAPNDYTEAQHQLLHVYQKGHLALWHTQSQSLLAHAGVWPSWTIDQTLDIAKETLETIFQDIQAGTFHLHLYLEILVYLWFSQFFLNVFLNIFQIIFSSVSVMFLKSFK